MKKDDLVRHTALLVVLAFVGQIVFWLALIAGVLWLLRHFGVIGR